MKACTVVDKYDWTPEGMKECIYGQGDWIKREDYVAKLDILNGMLAQAYERIYELEAKLK